MTTEQRGGAPQKRDLTINPRLKELLDQTPLNGYVDVAIKLAETHKPDLEKLSTKQERIDALYNAAASNLAGVENVLEQVATVDEQVLYESAWTARIIMVAAPKGLINVLADREDVISIRLPRRISPREKN